jgi:translocation and assembly module TamA
MKFLASLAWILAALGAAGAAASQDQTGPASATTSIAYDVVYDGPQDQAVADRIKLELILEKKKASGAPTLGVLEARLDADIERASQVLKAFGYFDGTTSGSITKGPPVQARLVISQGQAYRIGRFDIVWQGARPAAEPETIDEDLPASGPNIVAVGDRIVAQLKAQGHFDARLVNRRAVLDRAAGKVDVTVTIAAGPIVTVGAVAVTGEQDLPEDRIVRLSELEIGELLTPPRLKQAEDSLMQTGLFNQARSDPLGAGAERTVGLTVEERLPRSISGAIKYSLQDGYAIEAAWEHRNIFGDAEKLRAAVTFGSQRQGIDLSFRRYDTLFDGHTLLATLEVVKEDVDGQQFQQVALIGTLETKIFEDIVFRYGGSLEYVRDESQQDGGDFALIGLRAEVSYDGSNDLLDPTEGYRASFRVNPYVGYNDDLRNFTIVEAMGSAYLPLDDEKTWVLAGRARIGAIIGDGRDDVPLPKRFFAGGGGSIRGFGYKRAGPIDNEDKPIGGSSVVELNAEVRYRINEDFGAVVFVDGGGAFPELTPGEDEDYFIGAGAGVRYYSPIGPVRLDVAIPVSTRDGEPDYQIYVSIGQAF